MKTHSYSLLLIFFTSVLIACGGGDMLAGGAGSGGTGPITSTGGEPVTAGVVGMDTATSAPTATPSPSVTLGQYALKPAGSSANFLAYYEPGLQKSYTSYEKSNNTTSLATDSPAADTTKATDSDNTDSSLSTDGNNGQAVSTTNLIEKGVDEADIVKQNKTHIFTTSKLLDGKQVIRAFKKPDTAELGRLTLPNVLRFNGVFLTDKTLISIGNQSNPTWYKKDQLAFSNGKVRLDIIGINTPESIKNLKVAKTYNWDGELKASRRIGNSLYVISSSSVNNPWQCKTLNDTSCVTSSKLSESVIEARMPVGIDGNKVKPKDCLIPKEYDKNSSYLNSNITLVTHVDLSSSADHKTTCIAASAEHVYMNTKSLYLAGYNYNSPKTAETLVNKFSLTTKKNEAVNYKGSGAVKGYINWTAPSFSMHEHQDILRILTTEESRSITNMLHTLKESDDKIELTTLATLPNAQNPTTIGKPNERVQGVRFFGNEGYVVTFKNTDPLYKIDLSNPAKPKILGQLEIPGYSAYLHRINSTYLLGVGYAANDKGGITGIQITVFDTSSDNPVIVSQETITAQTAESQPSFVLPVAQDSRAIMTLTNDKSMRLAVPYDVEFFEGGKTIRNSYSAEYEIDLITGQLTTKEKRIFGSSPYITSSLFRRALLDGNDIYYNHQDGWINNYVWAKKSPTKRFIYIADQRLKCTKDKTALCLQYKTSQLQKNWQLFHGKIKDFNYEKGYEYTLEVEETIFNNSAEKTSSTETTLVNIVSKTKTD